MKDDTFESFALLLVSVVIYSSALDKQKFVLEIKYSYYPNSVRVELEDTNDLIITEIERREFLKNAGATLAGVGVLIGMSY